MFAKAAILRVKLYTAMISLLKTVENTWLNVENLVEYWG
jgi:hypothetical protein